MATRERHALLGFPRWRRHFLEKKEEGIAASPSLFYYRIVESLLKTQACHTWSRLASKPPLYPKSQRRGIPAPFIIEIWMKTERGEKEEEEEEEERNRRRLQWSVETAHGFPLRYNTARRGVRATAWTPTWHDTARPQSVSSVPRAAPTSHTLPLSPLWTGFPSSFLSRQRIRQSPDIGHKCNSCHKTTCSSPCSSLVFAGPASVAVNLQVCPF